MPALPRGDAQRATLWGDDVAALGFDLDDGEAGGVPAAAEGFDEEDAGDEALALDDGSLLLVLKQILLRGDDVEIIDETALIPTRGNVESTACGINGLLLFLLGFAEDVERGQFVLDFLKCSKNGLAIAGDAGVPACASVLNLSAAGATGEDVFSGVGADCPENTLNAGDFGDVGALPAGLAEEIERRVVSGLGDADLCVGGGHQALGFSNVGAALEKIGWKTGVERGRLACELARRDVKVGSAAIDEDGDGVFELLALLQHQSGLRARRVEQGFFLGDVETGCNAAVMAGVDEGAPLLEGIDGAAEDGDFGIELAKIEIVAGDLRFNEQSDVLEIGGVGLVGGFGGFDAAAAFAEDIELVVDGEGDLKSVLLIG